MLFINVRKDRKILCDFCLHRILKLKYCRSGMEFPKYPRKKPLISSHYFSSLHSQHDIVPSIFNSHLQCIFWLYISVGQQKNLSVP